MTTQLDLLKRDWCERAEIAVMQHCRAVNPIITTDAIRDYGLVDEPEHPNWWGVLLARMKNKRLIERIGYQPSRRKEANGRPIALWRAV